MKTLRGWFLGSWSKRETPGSAVFLEVCSLVLPEVLATVLPKMRRLASMADDAALTISIDGTQVASFEFSVDGEFYTDPLNGFVIAAGSDVTFAATGPLTTTDYRLDDMTVTVVPEPSSAVLVGLMGLFAGLRRRRR